MTWAPSSDSWPMAWPRDIYREDEDEEEDVRIFENGEAMSDIAVYYDHQHTSMLSRSRLYASRSRLTEEY